MCTRYINKLGDVVFFLVEKTDSAKEVCEILLEMKKNMKTHNTTRLIILTAIVAIALSLNGIYTGNNDYFIASFILATASLFFISTNGTKKHHLAK